MASEPFETVKLPHLEDYSLHLVLFRQVENAEFLREQLLQGNSEFEYAFVDAGVILCRDHLLAACFRAVNDLAMDRLKTRNVHSEIVFSLSPNNNIAESFKRFGVSSSTTDIVAVKVVKCQPSLLEVTRHLSESVRGNASRVSDSDLADVRDLIRIGKIYKLDTKALDASAMLPIITGMMALKGT